MLAAALLDNTVKVFFADTLKVRLTDILLCLFALYYSALPIPMYQMNYILTEKNVKVKGQELLQIIGDTIECVVAMAVS